MCLFGNPERKRPQRESRAGIEEGRGLVPPGGVMVSLDEIDLGVV